MDLSRISLLLGLMVCLILTVESVPLDTPPEDGEVANQEEPKTNHTNSAPPAKPTIPSQPSHPGENPGPSTQTQPIDQEKGPEGGQELPPGVADKDAKEEAEGGASEEEKSDGHDEKESGDVKHDDDDADADDADDDDKDDHHDKKGQDHGHGHGHKWGYHGDYSPEKWSLINAKCSSDEKRQSPIDITTEKSTFLTTLDQISLVRPMDEPAKPITVKNNGHSVVFSIRFSLRVVGGDLGGAFQAAQLHFHWGETSLTGSEHTIDNTFFPLEMHIVTYNEEQYDSLTEAVSGENSLAVLGILFQISEEDNPVLKPLISMLESVQEPGSEAKLDSLDVESLLPSNTRDYYRYEGSLTTPPCAESVVWTVFRYTVNVSERQVAEFRELFESSDAGDGNPAKLARNWRPIQPLHTRLIYRSFALPSNSIEMLPYEQAIQLKQTGPDNKPADLILPDSKPAAGSKAASSGNGSAHGGIYSSISNGLYIGLVISSLVLML